MAVKRALEAHLDMDVLIQTDSKLIVDTFTEWLQGWKDRGMRYGKGKPVKNASLILEIDGLTRGRDFRWEHVRGHDGHLLNEKADRLASDAAQAFAGIGNPSDVECTTEFTCQSCYLTKRHPNYAKARSTSAPTAPRQTEAPYRFSGHLDPGSPVSSGGDDS